MGDWLNQFSDPDQLQVTIKWAELSASYVQQRRWLSRRIDAQHLLRHRKGLPFSHLRALACLANLDQRPDLEELIEGIQSEQLKVRDLFDRLERHCAGPGCGASLLTAQGITSDEVVMLVLGRLRHAEHPERDRDHQRRYFCSVTCAHAFLGRELPG